MLGCDIMEKEDSDGDHHKIKAREDSDSSMMEGLESIMHCPTCGKKLKEHYYETPFCGKFICSKIYTCIDCHYGLVLDNEVPGKQTTLGGKLDE